MLQTMMDRLLQHGVSTGVIELMDNLTPGDQEAVFNDFMNMTPEQIKRLNYYEARIRGTWAT